MSTICRTRESASVESTVGDGVVLVCSMGVIFDTVRGERMARGDVGGKPVSVIFALTLGSAGVSKMDNWSDVAQGSDDSCFCGTVC